MLMKEFVARYSTKDERSFLFEILHRVSRLDPSVMTASAGDPNPGWVEWPAVGDPSSPAFGAARA